MLVQFGLEGEANRRTKALNDPSTDLALKVLLVKSYSETMTAFLE